MAVELFICEESGFHMSVKGTVRWLSEFTCSSFSRIHFFHHCFCGCSEIPKILPHWVCAGVRWTFCDWYLVFQSFCEICKVCRHSSSVEAQMGQMWVSAGSTQMNSWLLTLSDPANLCWTLVQVNLGLDPVRSCWPLLDTWWHWGASGFLGIGCWWAAPVPVLILCVCSEVLASWLSRWSDCRWTSPLRKQSGSMKPCQMVK